MRKLTIAGVAVLIFAAATVQAAPLTLDGEIRARSSAALMPPSIDNLWQLIITRLAPDGEPVSQGDVVVEFDGGETQKNLLEKQSALKEKLSQREKLELELAEREKNEQLATAQQRAALDKAQRKAGQPTELVRRVDYQKLVIDRQLAESLLAIAERREALAAEQRRQERRLIGAEIALLEADVKQLQGALKALHVVAPRDGILLHKTNWQGEKFDVGSQVWRGLAVGEIPDPATLAVQAQLPERDLLRVSVGARARVSVEGGAGRALNATVQAIGLVVRSRSKVQPVPVVDLMLDLDGDLEGIRPGQPVRVEILDLNPIGVVQ
jgi:multidrug resistance efflux pump